MRSVQHDPGRVRVGAACAILDERGDVLLVRHSYGRLNWELPGGAAEFGEAPSDAARRELLEETGLELPIERLTGVYFEADDESGAMLHFVFLCRWDPALTPVPSSAEIAELGFWPADDLPRPISDFTERRIRDAAIDAPAAVVTIPQRQWRS
jgi:ADP-ribose pyrophosphatase YjhB (NUDIX family)